VDGDSPAFSRGAEQRTAAPSPLLTEKILVCATVVQIRRDWSLWHQNDEVRPFLLTLCVGGSNRDRATLDGLLLYSWSTASSPGEASVPFCLPTMVEVAREAFPGLGWARDTAKRRNNDEVWHLWFDLLRQKIEGHRPLFVGLFEPLRAQQGLYLIAPLDSNGDHFDLIR
jgi:hypothetical protein